jgi:hypothetical protein
VFGTGNQAERHGYLIGERAAALVRSALGAGRTSS